MKTFLCLAVLVLCGCGDATFQVMEDGKMVDRLRIRGTGSFTEEYYESGAVKSRTASTDRPGFLENATDKGIQILTLDAIRGN